MVDIWFGLDAAGFEKARKLGTRDICYFLPLSSRIRQDTRPNFDGDLCLPEQYLASHRYVATT
jgi:hypothetical protein